METLDIPVMFLESCVKICRKIHFPLLFIVKKFSGRGGLRPLFLFFPILLRIFRRGWFYRYRIGVFDEGIVPHSYDIEIYNPHLN